MSSVFGAGGEITCVDERLIMWAETQFVRFIA